MNQKEHLLHLCSYSYESGGPASVILNHSRFQIESGMDVTIASSMDRAHHPYPTAPGVQLEIFNQSAFSRILSEFSWSLLFWFIRKRSTFQYVHIHGLWYFGALLPFLVPNKAKKIVTVHGFLDPYAWSRSAWKKKLLWNLMQKRFLRQADMIHVISREEEQILLNLFPDLRSKIVFIPNGIEDPKSQSFAKPSPEFVLQLKKIKAKSSFVFLFLSRINRKKGLDILVDAFHTLSLQHGKDVHLIIAGPQDDYSNALAGQLATYPHQNIALFDVVTGSNKAYLLEQVDGFILPSYSEGFSIAALEALAYSKPCILSTRIGFATELLTADAAMICEPKQEEVFHAMQTLVSDLELQKRLATNARSLFLADYQIERVASDFMMAIKQV
ncbi:MAG: glycosyltransferase [Aquirufa sp.]|jgi:glycosyltransferase involved in cell wall biosynthesis